MKVAQLYPTLCDPMAYTVHGILQARILEWVAFPFSRGSSQPRDQTQISHTAGGFFTSWATRKPEAVVGCIQIVLHCTSDQGLLTTPRAAATSTGPANTTVHCSAYLLFCPSPDTTIQHQHSTLEKKLSPQHIRCVGLYLHGIQVLYHWIPGSYINWVIWAGNC